MCIPTQLTYTMASYDIMELNFMMLHWRINSSASLLILSGSHEMRMASIFIIDGHTSVVITMTTACNHHHELFPDQLI